MGAEQKAAFCGGERESGSVPTVRAISCGEESRWTALLSDLVARRVRSHKFLRSWSLN